jgi:hypothetical protein
MPYADVRINITRAEGRVYLFMDSEFHITTNTTQNATLAFVYPTYSDDISNTSTSVTSTDTELMQIYLNSSLINYTIIHFDDFVDSDFVDDIYSYTSISVDFAIFDVEMIANTTMVFSTESHAINDDSMDRFDYSYVVGSARTFEGHTIERVSIYVTEEVPFASKSFYPNESLTINENDIVTEAIWDINSSEFSQNYVSFSAMVQIQGTDWLTTLSITAVVVLIVFITYQFAYKKSK